MTVTSIEWTERTTNPIRARNRQTGAVGHFCEKISPGCGHCYAAAWNLRVRPTAKVPLGTGLDFTQQNLEKVEVFLDESKLFDVLRRKKPTKWFWCDMTDIFGEWVTDEWIDRCFATMALSPQHTHQVLTKRPERMRDYLRMVSDERDMNRWAIQAAELVGREDCPDLPRGGFGDWPWPLSNVWLGVSVEDQQRADERIPVLLQVPAAVRFLSCEPLLGPVDLKLSSVLFGNRRGKVNIDGDIEELPGVDWVIVGGESGPKARPCHVDWIRDIVNQCRDASVSCFVKQLGANVVQWRRASPEYPTDGFDCELVLCNPKGADPSEWPEDLRIRQFPGEVS